MSKIKNTGAVLSVNVTPSILDAVLLQKDGEKVRVVRRVIRQRGSVAEKATAKSLATALPGLKSSGDADYSLEIGGGNGLGGNGAGLFMASEFVGLEASKKSGVAEATGAAGERKRAVFPTQLTAIVDECREAGVDNPVLVFCAASPDVGYSILHSGPEAGEKHRKEAPEKAKLAQPGGAERKRLLEILHEQRSNGYENDRVAFIPMSRIEGRPRHLAIVPEPSEPVSPTLAMLVEKERHVPTQRVMDAEIAALARLVRKSVAAEREDHTTAFVRVGSEETLILFFAGSELRHYERLRSLSMYDAPDTVCSRILLQQDEQKIGEVQHVILLSEGRPDQLLEAFGRFYPDSVVETAQDALTNLGVIPPSGSEAISASSVAAVAAGLRVLEGWDSEYADLDIHLLPRKIQRDRKKVAFGWHTLVVAALVFVLAAAFTWRYLDQQQEIERQREELRANPVEFAVDNPALLKARVDSLQNAYMTYTKALHVLDSLLVGSDRWARMHERVTRSTGDIGGIWLTQYRPMGSRSIAIEGVATTRSKIAQFARRHQASIEGLASIDIKHQSRAITLYEFTAVAPVPSETPRVAQYLQDVAAGHIRDSAVDSVLAAYQVNTLYPPEQAPNGSR